MWSPGGGGAGGLVGLPVCGAAFCPFLGTDGGIGSGFGASGCSGDGRRSTPLTDGFGTTAGDAGLEFGQNRGFFGLAGGRAFSHQGCGFRVGRGGCRFGAGADVPGGNGLLVEPCLFFPSNAGGIGVE